MCGWHASKEESLEMQTKYKKGSAAGVAHISHHTYIHIYNSYAVLLINRYTAPAVVFAAKNRKGGGIKPRATSSLGGEAGRNTSFSCCCCYSLRSFVARLNKRVLLLMDGWLLHQKKKKSNRGKKATTVASCPQAHQKLL
uniref:Uncharacterized protein n=1 Tax=Ditylenchus dipsaci TaxID=166011 RepID=A0A915D2N8_9BILA